MGRVIISTFIRNKGNIKRYSDYDLDIRNGDTDRSINMIVGTIGSTPEISISDSNVNLLGSLDITHSTVTTSERVKMDNPDSDGSIFLSINGAIMRNFKCGITC